MTTDEIRERFLKFFEARGHKLIPSDSLVPAKDPSILFTGAGMNQFKEQFLGRNITYSRAATSQKCLRTADLENVGRTAGHHTFFEMLGNFSFGDYFKREAIGWAWEFLVKDLGVPQDRLSVSVYEEDDETYDIWLNAIKIPRKRLLKLGDKENFWPQEARKNGPNGPCGPCSEIFYNTKEGGHIEVWNLVFTQFNRKEGGVLEDLPNKNIDTGMGIERLASVMQGVDTNFEIDIFVPIIQAIKRELGPTPNSQPLTSNINAIADHIRAITFAICDGVYPSNEERGFVVRKLIRRATQRALNVRRGHRPFLYKLVPAVAAVMKTIEPELEKKREVISQIVKSEEERFYCILLEVVPRLKDEFLDIKGRGLEAVPGDIIFRYSDEKGVPVDFQKEIADEAGISLDMEGFAKFLTAQKERSRAGTKLSKEIFAAPSGLAKKKDEEWDEASRIKLRINHTATHLLHSALRRVLGIHVWQSGSLVYPDRLRFDFTHPKKLDEKEVEMVEDIVNKNIAAGYEVKKEVMKLEDAKREGAIALFGEKYGDEVTVRSIGGFSKELCSGDHIDNTKSLRVFKIIQETSISAGQRRIEAVTGDDVYDWLIARVEKSKAALNEGLSGLERLNEDLVLGGRGKLQDLDRWIGAKDKRTIAYDDIKEWSLIEAELAKLMEAIIRSKKKLSKETARQKEETNSRLLDSLIKNSREIKGINVITGKIKDMETASLRKLIDSLIERAPNSAILLASDFGGKVSLVLAVGKTIVKKGINAEEIIKPIAALIGGSGGGRPSLAQAGGRDGTKLNAALDLLYGLIEEKAR